MTTSNKSNTQLLRDELTDMARLAAMGQGNALADALIGVSHPAEFVEAARHHGLAPVFHSFTKRRTDVPESVAQPLARVYQQNRARSVVLLGEAQRISNALETAGIPCIPLKGAALAEDLYGDPALRPMTDVDILIPPEHLTAARRIMADFGYHEESEDLREGFEEEFRSEISFFREKPFPSRVEIHWGLLNFGGHEAWVPDAFSRSVVTARGRRLTDEDTLLYLAAHAAYHHQNDRLLWEFDIALLLQARGAGMDDALVSELAANHRLLMPLRWALETGERLGVVPPPHLLAILEERKVGRVERWALRFARDPDLAGAVRTLLTIRSAKGWKRRWRLISAKLFPDHKHLETRHQARGFWPWIYAKRIGGLIGRVVAGLVRKARG